MREVFEKIIEEIQKLAKTGYQEEIIGEAVEKILDIAAKYNNGWIPCSERLPEGKEWEFTDADGDIYHKHALCQTDDSDVPMVAGFYQEGVWFTADTFDTIRVIAWQPLPQRYKPKEEQI